MQNHPGAVQRTPALKRREADAGSLSKRLKPKPSLGRGNGGRRGSDCGAITDMFTACRSISKQSHGLTRRQIQPFVRLTSRF